MKENIKPKNKTNTPIPFVDCIKKAPSKTGSNGTHSQNTQYEDRREAERILTDFTSEKHPVVWAGIGRKGRTKYIGVCGKTWKPYFFTFDHSHAIAVKGLVTDIDYCQDEDRCHNICCTLNKTTPESLARVKQLGPKDSKRLKKDWVKFTEKFSHYSDLAEICRKKFEEKGSAHILLIKSKPKRKREAENHV
jgi:hypothetical protein